MRLWVRGEQWFDMAERCPGCARDLTHYATRVLAVGYEAQTPAPTVGDGQIMKVFAYARFFGALPAGEPRATAFSDVQVAFHGGTLHHGCPFTPAWLQCDSCHARWVEMTPLWDASLTGRRR